MINENNVDIVYTRSPKDAIAYTVSQICPTTIFINLSAALDGKLWDELSWKEKRVIIQHELGHLKCQHGGSSNRFELYINEFEAEQNITDKKTITRMRSKGSHPVNKALLEWHKTGIFHLDVD